MFVPSRDRVVHASESCANRLELLPTRRGAAIQRIATRFHRGNFVTEMTKAPVFSLAGMLALISGTLASGDQVPMRDFAVTAQGGDLRLQAVALSRKLLNVVLAARH